MIESEKGMLLGFDPGGKKGFGWCILEDSSELPPNVIESGISNNAVETNEKIHEILETKFPNRTVLAAGIDAPLFWIASGDRAADTAIRRQVGDKCNSPSGTVQHVNSLRGACLVQGIMIAYLLRRRKEWSLLPITEAHPKAFVLTKYYSEKKLQQRYVNIANEHKRDAAIAGYSSWIMAHPEMRTGWRDLILEDNQNETFFSPIGQSLSYWFPMDC